MTSSTPSERWSMSPAVSVIIPSYNRAHMLGTAINSVLAQVFQDWELIVVDDGSTDNTEEVVHAFGDERIRYIRQGRNSGASAARNRCLAVSRGRYVAFLDSDDEWFPEKLTRQMAVFRQSALVPGAVYTGVCRVDVPTGRVRVERPRVRGDVYQLLPGGRCSPSAP